MVGIVDAAACRRDPAVPDVTVWEAAGRAVGRHGYGRPIARRLGASGCSVRVVPLVERAPTATELAAGRHVLSGGDTSVHSGAPWLAAARRALVPVVRRALVGDASVTGICFGAQLLATVLAGPRAVGPHPAGLQAGLVDVVDRRTGERHVASSFHYHHVDADAIGDAGAEIVFGSEATAVQAFEVAGVRGVQFHPELAPAQLRRALAGHADVLERCGADAVAIAAAISAARDRWTTELWSRFVALPAPAGPGVQAGLAIAS